MAKIYKQYLFYKSTDTIGGRNYYTFRVMLLDDTFITVYKLIGALPDPLMLLDLPTLLPSEINAGETFSVYSAGGTWNAPEKMYLLYLKDHSTVPKVTPDPIQASDVLVGKAFAENVDVVYVNEPVYAGIPHPPGDGPTDHPPTNGNWYEPSPAHWAYATIGVAQRIPSAPFAAYKPLYAWCWDGTEGSDPLHFFNFMSPATYQFFGEYQWTTSYFIDSNLVGTGTGFLIEHRSVFGNEYIDLTRANPSVPYYYFTTVSLPQSPSIDFILPFVLDILGGIMLLNNIMMNKNISSLILRRFKLAAERSQGYLLVNTDDKLLVNTDDKLLVNDV